MLQNKLNTFTQNIKLPALTVAVFLLLGIKLLAPAGSPIAVDLAAEFVSLFLVYAVTLNLINTLGKKPVIPLSVVVNIGVLNLAVILFYILVDWFFKFLGYDTAEEVLKAGPVFIIITMLLTVIIMGVVAYNFKLFKDLFFYKQKRNLNTYFNAMIWFAVLASVSAISDRNSELSFIKIALTVNAIILIFINSVRTSWIAYLNKREKKRLLLYSVILATTFAANMGQVFSESVFMNLQNLFSATVKHMVLLTNVFGIVYFTVLFFSTLFHLPTAEVFDRKADEVSALQYFSKLINQAFDIKEMTDTATEVAIKMSGADAAWLQVEGVGNTGIKNIAITSAEKLGQYLLHKSGGSVKSAGYFDISSFSNVEFPGEKWTHAAVVPLRSHAGANGTLFLLNKSEVSFDEEERKSIETFTDYITIAFENARLLRESIDKERLERELDVAREMQRKLIPQQTPVTEKALFSAAFIPAFEVGGDYYDFFQIENSKIGFIVADVAGKGISAAFVMAELRGIFSSLSRQYSSPAEILCTANKILKRTLDKKSFVSAVFGIVDTEAGKVRIARAGHPPLLLMRNDRIVEIAPKGIGLGLNFTSVFKDNLQETEFELEDGDVCISFTDGVTEAKNIDKEDYGLDRLKELLLNAPGKNPESLIHDIIEDVSRYSQATQQHDDITLVLFSWNLMRKV